MLEIAFLCLFAFLAGFVDSVVGGGGLIQLPALFVGLPKHMASVPLALGTNKFASFCGTSMAVLQYARRVQVPWTTVLPAAIAAFIFSAFGVKCVQMVRSDFLKPLMLVLLVAVAVYTYMRKDFGSVHAPRFVRHHERLVAIGAGMVIGFYDGFFGPGTGSFLIFIFIGLFRFDFLTASASAKVINFMTNFAAVLVFGWAAQILWKYAVPMAVCNMGGAILGTRMAVVKGNRFVRGFFLIVVAVMIIRYGWELLPR